MGLKPKNSGFSLTEVLLSVGVLAVGMIFIAGVFPVGIHYTTIAIEQTKAAIVADEAFAKVRLYQDNINVSALDPNALEDFNDVLTGIADFDSRDYAYPSTDLDDPQKRYYWSALCRQVEMPGLTGSRLVEVTVFVCRKIGRNPEYYNPDGGGFIDWPRPVEIGVSDQGGRELRITGGDERFITDGCRIVDDETGRRYRVLERYASDDDTVLLDAAWEGGRKAWVVPPPVNGGRNPCIAVYQREIQF